MFFIEERINNKIIRFYDPIYNTDGNIEFKGTTMRVVPDRMIYLDKDLYLTIGTKNLKYKLSEDNISKVEQFKDNMVKDINSFWKRVIADKEELIFLKVSDCSSKYLLTTQTVLDKGHMSPKFNQGLEFIFSERITGQKFYEGNFSDLMYFLSDKISCINNESMDEFKIKYSSLIEKLKK